MVAPLVFGDNSRRRWGRSDTVSFSGLDLHGGRQLEGIS